MDRRSRHGLPGTSADAPTGEPVVQAYVATDAGVAEGCDGDGYGSRNTPPGQGSVTAMRS